MTKLEEIENAILDVVEKQADENFEVSGLMRNGVISLICRAVVEAMRNPSKTAIQRGVDYRLNTSIGGDNKWADDTRMLWQEMIDAILNEGDRHD